jgi:hypothetical protein
VGLWGDPGCKRRRSAATFLKKSGDATPVLGGNHSPEAAKWQCAKIICFWDIANRPLLARVFKELQEQETGGFWNNVRSGR